MSACRGSVFCEACGGVCSTEDPDRLEDVFRKRRLAEEAEAKRGAPEPEGFCRCTGPLVEWPAVCPTTGSGFHILKPAHREDVG